MSDTSLRASIYGLFCFEGLPTVEVLSRDDYYGSAEVILNYARSAFAESLNKYSAMLIVMGDGQMDVLSPAVLCGRR